MGNPSAASIRTYWPKHLLRGGGATTTHDHQPHRQSELTGQIGRARHDQI